MKPILEVQHIGKEFFIGGQQERYLSLRDVIANPLKKLTQPKTESFWALDDVSFNIMPGESVGIIGRNGAGKSTLLKILSKITPPTSGKIICRGRVASLLEVGTGFHPELTGRENIYMNGSILGMRKWEIDKHFDAIVEFSGVNKFLDTPLKRYSSGMQLRLAFAVAAHLEPEILVIDEVLAVGDTAFQKKCLGKMREVSMSGRTVLFVSHDMNAIQKLCARSILLNKGKVEKDDSTDKAVTLYLNSSTSLDSWTQTKEPGHPYFKQVSVILKGEQPHLVLEVTCIIRSAEKMQRSFIAFDIANGIGVAIGQAMPKLGPFIDLNNEEKEYTIQIDLVGFVPGDYLLSAWIGPHYSETYDWQKEIIRFSVVNTPQAERTFPHVISNGSIVLFSKMI